MNTEGPKGEEIDKGTFQIEDSQGNPLGWVRSNGNWSAAHKEHWALAAGPLSPPSGTPTTKLVLRRVDTSGDLTKFVAWLQQNGHVHQAYMKHDVTT